jgi:predicted DNA-binding WGR domain protein
MDKVTDKTVADFEDQEASYDERLEFYDTRKNHNKFWHVRVFGCFVVRQWGRHGSKGQSTIHLAYSEWDAREEADKLYWKKKDKGYVKDQTTILDHIARKL